MSAVFSEDLLMEVRARREEFKLSHEVSVTQMYREHAHEFADRLGIQFDEKNVLPLEERLYQNAG